MWIVSGMAEQHFSISEGEPASHLIHVHVAASALKLWVLEQALLPVRGSPRLRLAHAAEAAALGARGTAHAAEGAQRAQAAVPRSTA